MSKIVFLHYRTKDKRGNLAARSGATVALQQLDDGAIRTSVAFCNSTDNYNKSTGRAVAGGRLLFGKDYAENQGWNIGEMVSHCDRIMARDYNYHRQSKPRRPRS